MVAVDIDHFKLFNRFYGREKGDIYLETVGRRLSEVCETFGGIAGYLGGDDFALLVPDSEELLADMEQRGRNELISRGYELGYAPKFGVFLISDVKEPVMDVCDHAFTALSSIRTDYAKLLAWYHPDMVRSVRDEFILLSDVERALKNDEFTFYIQPKCNMLNGKVVGAEALIRWAHKANGLVAPDFFIPVLEKNGFITKVDQIVWEQVCKWLRGQLDAGRTPLPVSVNVSRNDLFSLDFTQYMTGLLNKYELPIRLIELEITESSYMEELDRFGAEIAKLHEAGFSILLDDFGSGYSSINSLRELDIDILKIDMKFLNIEDENQHKNIGILESLVNMANQLRLPVIIEGVEMKDQVSLLTEMGCAYAQGYYYYHPMSPEEFARLTADEEKVDRSGVRLSNVGQVHIMDFAGEKFFSDEVVNNILGAVAFYEVTGDVVRLLRLNEPYYKMMDMEYVMQDAEYATHLRQSVYPGDRDSFFQMFARADENPVRGATADIRYMKDGIDMRWIRFRIYPMQGESENGGRLYYGSLEDITEIYQANERE